MRERERDDMRESTARLWSSSNGGVTDSHVIQVE